MDHAAQTRIVSEDDQREYPHAATRGQKAKPSCCYRSEHRAAIKAEEG
jgi:hypothetical protein